MNECERCGNPGTRICRQGYHDNMVMCEPCWIECDAPVGVEDGCNDWQAIVQSIPAVTLEKICNDYHNDDSWMIRSIRNQRNLLVLA